MGLSIKRHMLSVLGSRWSKAYKFVPPRYSVQALELCIAATGEIKENFSEAQNFLPLFQRAMLNLKQCARDEKMAKDNMQNSDLLSAIWLDLGPFNKRERVLAL